ncbi:hypothetical protein [Clostridium grantii]|uniref:Vitamin B12 dependent methionine synthase, activation domain n=1 Tax=Clostridium grantii DSM 8605 TaxID=1121316 RepID=A0A1M5T3J9_9CLOT|nr:hypothetical protein [Clostridium grantii]SHH45321.1 hypothetical protein SAMN02745207_01182 [Clostridium grantii DSM 8605]
MPIVKNYTCEPRKNIVFNSIDCFEDSPVYEYATEVFESLKDNLNEFLDLSMIYTNVEIAKEIEFHIPKCYNKLCLCFVTLGTKVLDKIQEYFEEDSYFEGMLLDSICDDILFQYSNKLAQHIKELAENNNQGVSKKISPGDDQYPMEYNKFIIDNLIEKEKLDINIGYTESYMIYPVKSLAFIYAQGDNIKSEKDHNCALCKNTDCKFREEKICH